LPEAQRALARALALGPEYCASPEVYLPIPPGEAGLAFAEAVFLDLPRTRWLAGLKARLHMREVFAGASQSDLARVDKHLWQGLRADPKWLLNRGVLALMKRLILKRAGEFLPRNGQN
jgi:hypothetical protein